MRTVGRLILALGLVFCCCLSTIPVSSRVVSAADVAGASRGAVNEGALQSSPEVSASGTYTAADGIADAKLKIRTNDLPDWMQGMPWDEEVYSHDPYEYTLDAGCVTARIQPIWLLEGLETPKGPRDLFAELETKCTVVGSGQMEIDITADPLMVANFRLDRIGIWLPDGFSYVSGSSSLENLPEDDPAHCVPELQSLREGTAVLWEYP